MSNTTPPVSTTPDIPMTLNLSGKTIHQLCQMYLELHEEIKWLDADYNENGDFLNPTLERRYRHMRKPLEARSDELVEALYPHYLADSQEARENAKRLNMVGIGN